MKMVNVEFTKKLPRGKLDVVIKGVKFGLEEKGGYYRWEGETVDIVMDSEKDKLKVEVMDGHDFIAGATIPRDKVLEDFIT